MKQVLIVEDEEKISEVLALYLDKAGYDNKVISDGSEVVDWVKANEPTLILLDLNLPNKDGIDICKEVREFSSLPIIMITARVDEIDRLLGLEFGADDYICKPFSPREVVARVKANLRRTQEYSNVDASKDSGLAIDEERYQALLDGQMLELTPVEFRILKALANPMGSVWSRDKLLDRMYDDQRAVGDRTVDSHVTNLRKKLEAVRSDSDCIHSIYGVGYKLEL